MLSKRVRTFWFFVGAIDAGGLLSVAIRAIVYPESFDSADYAMVAIACGTFAVLGAVIAFVMAREQPNS